jgi:hypothetical protein
MSNPLLKEPRFIKWLSDVQTIIKQIQPEIKLEATAHWIVPPLTFTRGDRPRLPLIESDEWVRVDFVTTNRDFKGWCWVCSKHDPTDPFGTIKEGLIAVSYNRVATVKPTSGFRRNGKETRAFYTCGNIYDEFLGLGFLDLRDGSWMKIKDRKKQIAAYLLSKNLLAKCAK